MLVSILVPVHFLMPVNFLMPVDFLIRPVTSPQCHMPSSIKNQRMAS